MRQCAVVLQGQPVEKGQQKKHCTKAFKARNQCGQEAVWCQSSEYKSACVPAGKGWGCALCMRLQPCRALGSMLLVASCVQLDMSTVHSVHVFSVQYCRRDETTVLAFNGLGKVMRAHMSTVLALPRMDEFWNAICAMASNSLMSGRKSVGVAAAQLLTGFLQVNSRQKGKWQEGSTTSSCLPRVNDAVLAADCTLERARECGRGGCATRDWLPASKYPVTGSWQERGSCPPHDAALAVGCAVPFLGHERLVASGCTHLW